MNLNSLELKIFVSCPSDVNKEKSIVKNLCTNVVNKLLSNLGHKVHLEFVDFTHIVAEVQTRPQQIINERINDYNVYIGILHKKFGTPTGATNSVTGKNFLSGTEEEFTYAMEKKLADKNSVKVYFFLKDPIKIEGLENTDQVDIVMDFRRKLGSDNWINFFKTRNEFSTKIQSELIKIGIEADEQEKIKAKQKIVTSNDSGTSSDSIDLKVNIASLIPELPRLEYYLNRSVTEFGKSQSSIIAFVKEEAEKLFLKDIFVKEKRIVLLGNAGSGKSVELQQAANYLENNKNTQFKPVYKRFNTYVDENIEDFLPHDWKKVNPNLLVVFLDGLDEIQPQYFNVAVRRLISFSELHPDLRVVVSCRTNFYELPSISFSGTLTNFKVYVLNDVALSEVNDYLTNQLKIDGEKFIQDAYDSLFLDILQKPFFLNILINHYKVQGNFSVGRATIIEEFVMSMIHSDQEHFKSSIPIQKSKQEIISLLEKVAFVMEYLGKNYLTQSELEDILSDFNDREQIKRFSAFSKDPNKSQWMFEHNNIQEFLASRVLARQNFEDLTKLISFPPSHKKLKPTWVNTLSFFISIGNKELRDRVIDWLVNTEPEVLVKFEKERISKEIRVKIFKEIFDYYKQKNIWLSSNKFTYNDLARFGDYKEILDFLIDELENTNNTRFVRINALHVLDNFDLTQYTLADRENIKSVILNILEQEALDSYLIFSMLYGLAKLEITDTATVEYAVTKYRKRKNQYIRAGLYKLINVSNQQDKYINIYLEGLSLDEITEGVNDREAINLSDESWQLEEGLKHINTAESLRKLLSYFTVSDEDENSSLRHERIYNHGDIFRNLLKKLFKEYSNDTSLFDDIFRIYINLARRYDNSNYPDDIASFFVSVNKDWEVFKRIWFDVSAKDHERHSTIEKIMSDKIIKSFINEYKSRNFSNPDAINFHSILIWAYPFKSDKFYLVEDFEKQIHELSAINFERPRFIDWQAIHKKQTQGSFNSLFDTSVLLKEVKDIFERIGKEQITFNDTWDVRRRKMALESEQAFLSSATDLIRKFTIPDGSVSYNQIETFVLNNKRFFGFQIETLYNLVKGDKENNLNISKEQLDIIKNWCEEIASKTNLKTAVYNDVSFNGISVNNNAQYLWFFLNRLKLVLPMNKLLDFTLFYQFKNGSDHSETEVIDDLENFTNKKDIEKRVIQNLSAGIDVIDVWISNATYAINKNLKVAYPIILENLSNNKISDYYRAKILKPYFDKTKNIEALHLLLQKINSDSFRWYIIDILIATIEQIDYLRAYLKRILESSYESREEKLHAAKYLLRLNDLVGLDFVAKLILKEKNPQFDFTSNIGTLSHIKDIKAIPMLLKLLKLAKQPSFKTNRFNDFESYVLDTFYSIGIQSENNYLVVKKALENFIQANQGKIEYVNFIYNSINRIGEQLYLNRSQAFTISDAIKEYSSL